MAQQTTQAIRKRGRRGSLPFYLFLLPLRGLARALPFPLVARLGAAVGELLFRGVRHYREVALRNMSRAFDWDAERTEVVARQAFRNLGKTLVEFLRLPALSSDQVRRLCRVEGLEYIRKGLEAGRGVLLITAHYGNWELFAARFVLEGIPLC